MHVLPAHEELGQRQPRHLRGHEDRLDHLRRRPPVDDDVLLGDDRRALVVHRPRRGAVEELRVVLEDLVQQRDLALVGVRRRGIARDARHAVDPLHERQHVGVVRLDAHRLEVVVPEHRHAVEGRLGLPLVGLGQRQVLDVAAERLRVGEQRPVALTPVAVEVLERAVRRVPQGRGEDLDHASPPRRAAPGVNPTGVRCRSWRDRATGCPRIGSSRCWSSSALDHAIFMLDPHGRVVTWNAGAEAIKGYTQDEIIGRHFSVFYTEADVARNHPAEELRRRDPGRALRGGGMARPQGRHALLGERRDHPGLRRGGRARRVRQGQPRPHRPPGARRSRCAPGRDELEAANRQLVEFRRLVSSVRDYAIFMIDPPATSSPGTPAPRHLKGYAADEIIGRHFSVFYTPRTRPGAIRSTSSTWRSARAATRRRAGASARTAPVSGRA